MKTKEIEVKIMGKYYNFNVPEIIKTEDFLEIADFIEHKYRKIKREVGDLDSFKLGLLVALNIAEGLFLLKKENQQLKGLLNKIDHLISPLDNHIEKESYSEDENQMPILFNLE